MSAPSPMCRVRSPSRTTADVATTPSSPCLLNDYNKRGDLRAFGELNCACRDDWREEVAQSDPRPLVLRVAEDLPDLWAALGENRQAAYLPAGRSEPA